MSILLIFSVTCGDAAEYDAEMWLCKMSWNNKGCFFLYIGYLPLDGTSMKSRKRDMVDWGKMSGKYNLQNECSTSVSASHSSLVMGRHISNRGFLFIMLIQLLEYLSYQEVASFIKAYSEMPIDKIMELSYKASFNNKKTIRRDCCGKYKNMQRFNGVIHKVKPDQNLWLNQCFNLCYYLYLLVLICVWDVYCNAIFSYTVEIYESYFSPYHFSNLLWRTANSKIS